MGDLGDAPASGAEGDDIARPGLVHHLLIEFAYAGGLLGVGVRCEVHGEQAAVGDGATRRHGEALRTRPGRQHPRVSVVDQPRPQLGELGGRVLAGQQVERRLERTARQRGKRCAAPHGVEPSVGVQRLQRGCGDGVLGEHVERVGGNLHGLDLPGEHALHGDRAVDQVGAVLGEQHAARDLADLVAGATDALQPAGHRGRRLDLDHQVDRAHVDAQFQARGGDDGLQPPALEVVLDEGALFLADRAVVRLRQHRLRSERLTAAHDVRGGAATDLGIALVAEFDSRAFGVDLVEPGGEPLGQPP